MPGTTQLGRDKVGNKFSVIPELFLLILWPYSLQHCLLHDAPLEWNTMGLHVSKETELRCLRVWGRAGEALWSPQENPRQQGVLSRNLPAAEAEPRAPTSWDLGRKPATQSPRHWEALGFSFIQVINIPSLQPLSPKSHTQPSVS